MCACAHTHTPGSAIPHVGPAYNLASPAALQRRALPETLVLSGRPRVSGTGPGPQAFASAEKTPPCPPAWTRSPCHTWVLSADVGTQPQGHPVWDRWPGTVSASRPVCPLSSALGALSTHSPGLSPGKSRDTAEPSTQHAAKIKILWYENLKIKCYHPHHW